MQIFLRRALLCFSVFFLAHSCAGQGIKKYLKNEYNESYGKCLRIGDFGLLKDKTNTCKELNTHFSEFSSYTQKSLDSLNHLGETNFLIFNSIRNKDLQKCMFTYDTKTGKENSVQCEKFSDKLLKQVINDWDHFQNNKDGRFSRKPLGGHWLYYVISIRNKQINIEKVYY